MLDPYSHYKDPDVETKCHSFLSPGNLAPKLPTMLREAPTSKGHNDYDDHIPLQDEDDAELETLSLCDLPLYSDEFEPQQQPRPQDIIDHADPFEFSSGELLSASSSKMCVADNIIFCGRLIPCGREMPFSLGNFESLDRIGSPQDKPKKKKWKFFKWKFTLLRKHRQYSSKCRDESGSQKKLSRSNWLERLQLKNYRYIPEKPPRSNSFSMRRVSATSGRVKCRWYLLMFGTASRFPIGMKLQDMKTRRSRKCLSSKSLNSDDGSIARGGNCKDDKGNWNWGLWRLLKALSCSSSLQFGIDGAVMKS